MNARKNERQIKTFVTEFDEDKLEDSDPEEQDVPNDFAAHVLDISGVSDSNVVKTGDPHEDMKENIKIFLQYLYESALIHTITKHIPWTSQKACKNHEVFRDIIIDTGAGRRNTSSLKQFQANSYQVGLSTDIVERKDATCQFENSSESSQWGARILFPLNALTFTFYSSILRDGCVHFFICIGELGRWELYSDNIVNRLVYSPTG